MAARKNKSSLGVLTLNGLTAADEVVLRAIDADAKLEAATATIQTEHRHVLPGGPPPMRAIDEKFWMYPGPFSESRKKR